MNDKIIRTNLDIKDWFVGLPEKIDVWITDPPYPFNNQNGTGRYAHVNGKDNMYSRFEWSDMSNLFSDMYNATSNGGVCYMFCNRDGLFESKDRMEKAGWQLRNLLVWDKQAMGMGYHWRNQTEYILYMSKGKCERYVKGTSNIFSMKKPSEKDSIASIGYNVSGAVSAKPYKIWSKILEVGVNKDDIVADPFAGTDPLSAALKTDANLLSKIKRAYTNSIEL
jgi:site-specific DNA-methyltransferase (adenine-specific)